MTEAAIRPHPDVEHLSNAELRVALADADKSLEWLHTLPPAEQDSLLETWFVDERLIILAELNRRNVPENPFPLSSPYTVGKAGKQESLISLPLVCSLDLLPKEGEEPIDWLVEGLIPKGSFVLLLAPPGSYKTFFALSLSKCIGQGEPFLGRELEAGSVTYVDRENPRSVIGSRLKMIGVSSNLTVWPFWADPEPPALEDGSYLDLAANKTFLVFDSLRRFHTGSENAPEEMSVVMGYLRELTKQGTTVFALHHSGKAEGNLYRGSTEILAAVDIAFSIEKEKQQTRVLGASVPLTLKCIKHRYVEEPILNLEFVTEGERVSFRDVTADRREEKQEAKHETLIAIQGAMRKLENEQREPNQTQVLEALNAELSLGKNRALNFLSQGEGTYWKSEAKNGSRRYQTLSPFPETLGVGKPESLDDTWEQVQ
jgi:AAA domain